MEKLPSGEKRKIALRTQLILLVLFCWVLPIVVLVFAEGFLLNRDYERSIRKEMELTGSYAIQQTVSRFDTLFEESKTVSYDGVVRNAYRSYQLDGDSAALYRTVSSYFSQRFSHAESIRALFITFWNDRDIKPYVSNQPDDRSRTILTQYSEMEEDVLAEMREADTSIRFMVRDGRMYVARNLLDSHLKPYATVVIQANTVFLAEPLASLGFIGSAVGELDGNLRYTGDGQLTIMADMPENDPADILFDASVSGHHFVIRARQKKMDILAELPDLKVAIFGVLFLIIPLLISLIIVITRQVTAPVKTLVDATTRIQEG